VELRDYTDADTAATLTVFLRAIRETAAADYTPARLPPGPPSTATQPPRPPSRQTAHTKAAIDGRVAGFTDLDDNGHLDMLFVEPDFARQGFAPGVLPPSDSRSHRARPALPVRSGPDRGSEVVQKAFPG
jgi:putative acetyltransferase